MLIPNINFLKSKIYLDCKDTLFNGILKILSSFNT